MEICIVILNVTPKILRHSYEGFHCRLQSKASFILHCICVALSCSAPISISAQTTGLRHSKEMNLEVQCNMLSCIANAAVLQLSMNEA